MKEVAQEAIGTAGPDRLPSEQFLEARGISKRYGGVNALVDVSATIAPGEIVGLVGENGSGKSTLAKILAGVVQPDEGTVAVDGVETSFHTPRDALGAGIILVAQDPTAVPDMSLAENVMLGAEHSPWTIVRRRDLARRSAPHLARVGITTPPGTPLRVLPPGQRELVEVAKALVTKPRLMILDEATARFGEAQVERLFALVREEVARGMAAILITHRLREVEELTDRAVVLRDGHHVADLERGELNEKRLSEAMVGRPRPERIRHTAPDGPGRTVLEVSDLTIRHDAKPLSLNVHAGEIVGVAGLVGSGRTELLEAIAGVAPPLSGSVMVDGKEISGKGPRGSIRSGVSLVPEDRHAQGLMMDASVRANIALGSWGWAAITRTRSEERMAREAISGLSIKTASASAPVHSLSGGNQQKVVVGRCLATRPKLLLLDDPTVGVDVGARDEIYDLIAGLCRDGMAVLMTSSELPELLRLSDRICVMHERTIVGQLETRTATEAEIARMSGGGV